MKVLRSLEAREVREAEKVVLTIGVYDGVHVGHRVVIRKVVDAAKRLGGDSALITFEPYPREVLFPGDAPPRLTAPRQKERLLSELGLDLCIVLPFTPRLAREGASQFLVDRLLAAMDLRIICVGPHFGFGRGRGGDTRLLTRLGASHGVDVIVVEPVRIGGVHVSSTAIRELIARGELKSAARLLGRPFSIVGMVVRGKALGRKLGVRTANIDAGNMAVPPPAVYAVTVMWKGERRGGILNIDRQGVIEVHIFDFHEDIYGKEVELVFGERIREERDFPSLAELASQIRCDIAIAKEMLHNGEDRSVPCVF